MNLSATTLSRAAQCPILRAKVWQAPINDAMERFAINTAQRMGAFIAQVAHESGRFQFVREIWNPAQAPWQARYEGRADLGNTQPGDGKRYMGRGLIQITGRYNYRACGLALGQPFEDYPAMLEQRDWAAMSAAWFWSIHGCNELADAGDFKRITKRINGGYNGLEDRLALWNIAKEHIA